MLESDAVTNLVRRPVDGHVMTASGRRIPQPPWILEHDPQTDVAYDEWLISSSRDEAMETGDEWMVSRLEGLTARDMNSDLRHLLSDFLFGHPNPDFEARAIQYDTISE